MTLDSLVYRAWLTGKEVPEGTKQEHCYFLSDRCGPVSLGSSMWILGEAWPQEP